MLSEQQLMHKALLQDKYVKKKKKKKSQNKVHLQENKESVGSTRKTFISFNNLSKTDDICVPLVLSTSRLKTEIFIRWCIYAYMWVQMRGNEELNIQPEGSYSQWREICFISTDPDAATYCSHMNRAGFKQKYKYSFNK